MRADIETEGAEGTMEMERSEGRQSPQGNHPIGGNTLLGQKDQRLKHSIHHTELPWGDNPPQARRSRLRRTSHERAQQ
jgi:hypothetical protein